MVFFDVNPPFFTLVAEFVGDAAAVVHAGVLRWCAHMVPGGGEGTELSCLQ